MTDSIIRSRIDPVIKDQASKLLSEMGLTMSDAIRLFLHQVIAEKRLPFEVKLPNEETVAALDAIDRGEVEPVTLDELRDEWARGMREVVRGSQFKTDFKKIARSGRYKVEALLAVVARLASDTPLAEKYPITRSSAAGSCIESVTSSPTGY